VSKKILLIHGFSYHLINTFFGVKHSNKVGFKVFFDDEINKAEMFNWGIEKTFSWFQSVNLFSYLELYRQEKKTALSLEIQNKLQEKLASFKPEIIITHSMGAYLFLNYLNKFTLPLSVKKILFIQGDTSRNFKISNPKIIYSVKKELLEIENYHCFYDPTLLFSQLINFSSRIGLWGLKDKIVQNFYYPLNKTRNLHISSISDYDLKESVLR